MNPQVYILLATYNRAHLIEETLVSIQNQTYTNFKCIVVDDKSTDTTKEVVQNFSKYDKRFVYKLKLEEYIKGLPDTRNYGLDIASKENAEFITFFDDDDIMHPEKLEQQMRLFEKDPTVEFVSCRYSGFKDANAIDYTLKSIEVPVVSTEPAEDFLLRKIRIHSCGPVIRSYLVKDFRFDTELQYNAEEWEFYLRVLFYHRPKYAAVLDPLFYYRHHAISVTANNNRRIEKKGTDLIVSEKLWDFLSEKGDLKPRIIAYFIKQFSLEYYNCDYLFKVDTFIKQANYLGLIYRTKAWLVIRGHALYRKIFYKLVQ